MFAKKNCPKNDKLYIFEKPLTMPFQICKKFCKILNNLMWKWFKQRFSLLQEKAVIQAVCLRTQTVSIKARF